MYETLFHPALWMPAVGVVIGVVVFIVGNNRTNAAVRNAGLGVAAAAIAWIIVAYFVKTPVEQAIRRTDQIVSAVETADWQKLRTLLDRTSTINVTLYQFRGIDEIAAGTQEAAERYGLKEIRILNTETAIVAPNDDINVTINTLLDGARPTTGRFEFTYERRSDGLLLTEITPLEIGGRSLDALNR